MRTRGLVGLGRGKKLVLGAAALAGVATTVLVGIAQDAIDWQTRAGGKMAFEVASVKPGKGAFVPSNLPLTPWDEDIATNGRFRVDATLSDYIQFAYKLWPNEPERREFSRLPKWVAADRYSIKARAATGSPA